jgi:hypothetical protein
LVLDKEPTDASRVVRYVCIPGSPFTGSTLLGTLLNQHPDCASIGAAVGLIRRADLATYRCSCGQLFRECEFWNDVAARTRALGYPVDVFRTDFWSTHLRLSAKRLVNALLVRSLGSDPVNDIRDAVVGTLPRVRRAIAAMGWNTWALAAAVLDRTGKSVFVDTSRDHQRPKYLAMHPGFDLKVIHLIRDARGNSASIMKHTGTDAARAAKQWRHYNTEADRIRRYVPRDAWLALHYEDLCADPGAVLDRIADFIGVSPTRTSVGAATHASHIIGNKMRLTGVSEIREDRSWQTRLNPSDLEVLARIAGPTSRRLGYDWP